jgi:hypothetical protein
MQSETDTKQDGATRSRVDHRTGKRIFIHDASFWIAHVEGRRRLGESVHAYCSGRGLALSTFRRWAQRLEGRERSTVQGISAGAARFVEVPIVAGAGQSSVEAVVEVGLGGGIQVKLTGADARRVIGLVMGRIERAAQS